MLFLNLLFTSLLAEPLRANVSVPVNSTESAAALQAAQEAATAEATLDIEWEKIEDATSYQVKLTPVKGSTPLKFESKDTKLTQKLPVGTYKLQIRSKERASGYYGPWSPETEVEVQTKIVKLIS